MLKLISKILFIVIFFCAFTHAQITAYRYAQVSSDFVSVRNQSNKSVYHMTSSALMNQYKSAFSAKKTFKNKNDGTSETVLTAPVSAGGAYIIRISPKFSIVRNALTASFPNGYVGSNQELFARIPADEEEKIVSDIKSGLQKSYLTYTILPDNQYTYKIGKTTYDGAALRKAIAGELTRLGINHDYVFFFSDSKGKGIAIVKTYGTKRFCYAAYGQWTNAKAAEYFGCKNGERVYFSVQENCPPTTDPALDAYKYSIAYEQGLQNESKTLTDIAGIDADPRYGRYVFRESTAMTNKQSVYDYLVWVTYPLNSTMSSQREFTQDGQELPYKDGLYIPIGPDDANNTNPPDFVQYPDMDWYWQLFCIAWQRDNNTDARKIDDGDFQDYADYVKLKMNTENEDATFYRNDESMTDQYVSTDNPPGEPFLYDKECNPLNIKDDIQYYDPFDPGSHFYLQHKYYKWFSGGSVRKTKYNDVDITGDMRKAIEAGVSLFEKIKTDNFVIVKDAKINGYRDLNIPSLIASDLNSGIRNVHCEIALIDKDKYNDLTTQKWIVGNPFKALRAYESSNDFLYYDYIKYAEGQPFKTNAFIDNKGTWESVTDWVIVEGERQDQEKYWYITWKWPIVYVDKYAFIRQIGYLFAYVPLKKERGELLAPGDDGKNSVPKITGTKLITADYLKYSKDSREYHQDQMDVSERDNKIDKGEAMAEIAKKIAFAELMNESVRLLHEIANSDKYKNPLVKGACIAAYQTQQRLVNISAVKKTYKMAKEAVVIYLLWRETMDAIADARNLYVQGYDLINQLNKTTKMIADYYTNLDWKSIRPTNITKVFPTMAFYSLDWSIAQVRGTLMDATKALEKLCLITGATSEYYVNRNKDPLICVGSSTLSRILIESGEATTKKLDNANIDRNGVQQALNAPTNIKGGLNPADQWKLVNYLRNTREVIKNNDLRIMNDKGLSFAVSLMMIEDDANSWVQYSKYMSTTLTPQNLSNIAADCKKTGNLWPVFEGFNAPVLFSPAVSNRISEIANESH